MPPKLNLAGLEADAGHLVLLSCGLGCLVLILFQAKRIIRLRERYIGLQDTSEARIAAFEERLTAARDECEDARNEADSLRERLGAAEARNAELPASLSSMALEAVETAHKSFLARAGETFEHQQYMATGRLEKLLEPVARNFETFRDRIDALERTRNSEQGALFEQVRALGEQLRETQATTGKLANALDPSVSRAC